VNSKRGNDGPKLTLYRVTTRRGAMLIEADIPAADDRPEILAGFVFHVPGSPFRVLTVRGSLLGVHPDEDAALRDLQSYAAQLLERFNRKSPDVPFA
jgi:hypothetical protein